MGVLETIQRAVTVGLRATGNLRTSITYSHPKDEISLSTTCTFAVDGTLTASDSFEDAGFAVADIVSVKGADEKENNQIWVVSAIDDDELTVNTTYRAPVVEVGASITIQTVNYHPDSGTNTRGTADYTINAIILNYGNSELMANPSIESNDRKLIFDSSELSVTPSTQGTVTIDSTAYEIKDVSKDPASATWKIRARKMV